MVPDEFPTGQSGAPEDDVATNGSTQQQMPQGATRPTEPLRNVLTARVLVQRIVPMPGLPDDQLNLLPRNAIVVGDPILIGDLFLNDASAAINVSASKLLNDNSKIYSQLHVYEAMFLLYLNSAY